MAVTIELNCARAFAKLSDSYKRKLTNKKVVVYIPNGTHIDVYGRSMPISMLVYILVHGTSDGYIPPRPFTTDAGLRLKQELLQLLKQNVKIQLRDASNPNSLGQVFIDFSSEEVAKQAVIMIKQWLFDGSYYQATCPNASKTISNKGSDVPLVHTGQLVNSITAKVAM